MSIFSDIFIQNKIRIFCVNCGFSLLTDSHLLTIETKDENDFLANYITEHPLITNQVWLGIDLDTQGKSRNLKIKAGQ